MASNSIGVEMVAMQAVSDGSTSQISTEQIGSSSHGVTDVLSKTVEIATTNNATSETEVITETFETTDHEK